MSTIMRHRLSALGFLFGSVYLRVGDFHAQLAMGGTMWKSYFMPSLDLTQIHLNSEQISSWVFWLPAFLLRVFEVPFIWTLEGLLYLQFILLGFALFELAYWATQRFDVAWAALLLNLALDPSDWNFAMAGTARLAYPSQMVLGVGVIAALLALKGRPVATLIALTFMGWTQPAITLYTPPMIGLYWLLDERLDRWAKVKYLSALVGVMGLILIPPLIAMHYGSDPMTREAKWKYLTTVWGHGVPWKYPRYFAPVAAKILMYMCVLFVGYRLADFLPKNYRKLLRIAFFCSVVLSSLATWLGITAKIPSLIHSMPWRCMALMNLFALPLAAIALLDNRWVKPRRAIALGALTLFALVMVYRMGATSRTQEAQDMLALQQWAQDKTSPDAVFLSKWLFVYGPIAKREEIVFAPQLSGYIFSRVLVDQIKRLHDFVKPRTKLKDFEARAQREGYPETYAILAAFLAMEDQDILDYARQTGAHYLVLQPIDRPRKLPIVFKTKSFIVQDLRSN